MRQAEEVLQLEFGYCHAGTGGHDWIERTECRRKLRVASLTVFVWVLVTREQLVHQMRVRMWLASAAVVVVRWQTGYNRWFPPGAVGRGRVGVVLKVHMMMPLSRMFMGVGM